MTHLTASAETAKRDGCQNEIRRKKIREETIFSNQVLLLAFPFAAKLAQNAALLDSVDVGALIQEPL